MTVLVLVKPHLHRSEPCFTLILREGPPLTPDTRFYTTISVYGRDEREQQGEEYMLRWNDGHLVGPVAMYEKRGRGGYGRTTSWNSNYLRGAFNLQSGL